MSYLGKLLVGGREGMSIACPPQRPGLTLHRSSKDGDIICPRISPRVGDIVLRRKPIFMRCPEIVMVRIHLLLFLCISTSVFAQQLQVPEIEFQSVPHPLKFPADLYLGEAAGVAVNSKGHIFVLSRGNSTGPADGAAAAQLLEFDAEGRFLREIGHNLYAWSYAHSVKVDPEDNIWVADKGSAMVIKFSPEGRVAMVFGRKQEASDEKTGPLPHPDPPLPPLDGMFRQVTDMAWDKAGNTYISDGYINSRIAKVDKKGNWIKSWGEPGELPGQFSTPHSIAVDAKENGSYDTPKLAAKF
jgi:hypothetical protein